MGAMEIRIVLDDVEPPAGHLHVLPAAGRAGSAGPSGEEYRGPGRSGPEHVRPEPDAAIHARPRQYRQIRFTGWLGLLRALQEVITEHGTGPGR